MKVGYTFFIFSFAFILQITVMNMFRIMNVAPNIILCLVIILSFLYEEEYKGIIFGTIFGLVLDVCYGLFVGVSAIGFLLIGFGVILIKEILNKENIISIIIVTAAATILFNMHYWATMALFGSECDFLYWLKLQPIYVLYNILFATIFYLIMINKVIKHRSDRYYK